MQRNIQLKICLFLFLLPMTTSAQEYLWPTDASHWITSAFGEHRPRRLHAAIDIKTWGQSGYKIFAVRDGYVSRIRVSPSGYGKAVYLKLDTGEIAIFAHLSGFNKALSDFVYHEQQKNNRYRVDRYLSATAFPVKKGDFLGYSGETGIGVPHLHFELRDSKNRPFNPFLRGYKIKDVRAPTVRKIAFIPLKFGTRINDDFVTHIASLKKIKKGHFELTEPVSFDGEVGVGIRAFDKSGTVTNAFGVYKLSLYIDGHHYFTSQFDKFSYANNRFMDLDREYRLRRRGFGKYYRLFLDPANPLSFYDYRGPEKGRLLFDAGKSPKEAHAVINDSAMQQISYGNGMDESAAPLYLSSGRHALEVIVEDFFGNATKVTGELIAGKKYQITPQYSIADGHVFLNGVETTNSGTVDLLHLWKKSVEKKNNWLFTSRIKPYLNGTTEDAHESLPFRLFHKGTLHTQKSVQIVALNDFGLKSWPAFLNVPNDKSGRAATFKFESDYYDHWVRFKISATHPLRKKPIVELTSSDRSTSYPEIIQSGQMEYIVPVSLYDFNGANVRILVSGETLTGENIAADSSFDNFHIQHKTSDFFASADGKIRIDFHKSSLYDDIFGRAYFLKSPHRKDKDAIGGVYVAEPQDVVMNRGATVTMSYPADFSNPEKLGIYYKTPKRWAFIDNKIDTVKKQISAKVFSLEEFAIRKDDTTPEVRVFTPKEGEIVPERPLFKVRAKDEQTGFSSEESLLMLIDGKKAIAEYDPETGLVQYKPRNALEKGQHVFQFSAIDRSENTIIITRNFMVK
ncbi:MAG: hypothetical protein DWQ05_18200 [Calditrichaeota bacterium]|nr:MAG: hypothetical protein DWQ05_18200 [Calditrichota bacterium]